MDWETVKPELRKMLDPAHVRPAPKGKFGDYVDGYHVISEANRIFEEDGWSYEITDLRMVSEQTIALTGKDGPYDQYRVGYLCRVRANVDGVIREGAAVGSGMGSPNSVADHHESAVKEAETDALKRALRSFGNTFGLALYDKTKSNVGIEFQPPAFRDHMKPKLEAARTLPDLHAMWVDVYNHKDQLPEPMFLELEKAKNDRKSWFEKNDPAMQRPAAE